MRPVLKYPGAKWKQTEWIIENIPDHHTYLEPFFGSGAVFFSKKPSPIETVNDLDNNVINLFSLIRDNAGELARRISTTPFARYEYDSTFDLPDTEDDFEKARRFLVQCWQGHGFRTNGYKVGWKNDIQGREQMYAAHNWYRLPKWIMDATDRLKQVQIENRPAVEVIKRHKYSNVFIYADPPYLLGTRTAKQYKYEMTDKDHVELLEALKQHPGPVMISGYQHELYDEILEGWNKESENSIAEHGRKREEVIWMNFEPKKGVQLQMVL